MKKRIHSYAILIFVMTAAMMSALATGCSGKFHPEHNIAIAREAIAREDFEEALSALDEVSANLTDTTASPSVLTETAVLYCLIDEKLKNDDNMSKAYKCYELAMRINPDSVSSCFGRLSPDEKCQFDILYKLTNASNEVSEFDGHAAGEPIDMAVDTEQPADGEIYDDIDIIE